jgi:hypothetical protein
MMDLTGGSTSAQHLEREHHLSLEDIRGRNTPHMVELLDHGSPSGSETADPAILDADDSDGSGDTDNEMHMTVDVDRQNNIEDPLYHQCKKARRSAFTDRLVSVSGDGTFGSSVTTTSIPIGQLTDHGGLSKTFHGSRIREGSVTVNQTISLSFVPNKMTCVSCETEHAIISNLPVTVFFTDQNFIAKLPGSNNSCLNIVRMEDASLSELFNLSKELFGKVKLPEGSVLLFGSVSFLSRVGTGMYAQDWQSLVINTVTSWPGTRVCPLIPLIVTECPGSVARELAELAAWLAIVYDNNPLGMQVPWAAVVAASEKLSVGAITLPAMDTYKIPLPQSLADTSLVGSMTFCSVSSRPATLNGLPKDNLDELVRTLLDTVHWDFQTCAHPENFLARELQTVGSNTLMQKVILLGASNIGHCADRLRREGFEVVDLSSPGWLATPDNIALLLGKLEKIPCGTSDTLILDLYGNLSYRFEQFDGSISLPYKSKGRYHLAGNVVTCPLQSFRKVLENTTAVFSAKKDSKMIVIPPLPRFLFAGCCSALGHSTNVDSEGHAQKLLTDIIGLRTCLKKFVASLSLGNCRVMDSCCVTECVSTANITTRLDALKTVTATDSVHFTSVGYENLVRNIVREGNRNVSDARKQTSSKLHFWRGFRSTFGAAAVTPNYRTNWQPGRDRGGSGRGRPFRGGRRHHPFHPYRKN